MKAWSYIMFKRWLYNKQTETWFCHAVGLLCPTYNIWYHWYTNWKQVLPCCAWAYMQSIMTKIYMTIHGVWVILYTMYDVSAYYEQSMHLKMTLHTLNRPRSLDKHDVTLHHWTCYHKFQNMSHSAFLVLVIFLVCSGEAKVTQQVSNWLVP